MSIIRVLSLLLCCLSIRTATAAGILVRFLASPPEDSVVRYDIWRLDSTASALVKIGSLAAGMAAADTLAFPDSTARKGVAYLYCLRAVNAAGLESEPSDSARVAVPRLALPDTVRPTAGQTRLPLAPGAHPLAGIAPLAVSLADSTRLRLVHDTATGSLIFLSPLGLADTVTAVIRASYHGKFQDVDTVLVMVAGRIPSALPSPRAGDAPATTAWRRADGSGGLLLAFPSFGRVRLHRADGRLVP